MKKAIVICGPTGSGKSDIAHHIAKTLGGIVINADSKQIYKEIPIITASPVVNNEVPYYLYNHKSIVETYNVWEYIQDVVNILNDTDKVPILVGGTGMYINSLIYGLHRIPEINKSNRQSVMDLFNQIGKDNFYKELINIDPQSKEHVRDSDTKRMIRAYEVKKFTNKSLYDYHQNELYQPMFNYTIKVIMLNPKRKFLYDMCNKRLKKMFVAGIVDEVKSIQDVWGKIPYSTRKTLALEEVYNYLQGTMSYDEALSKAQQKTRNYAKRQLTWFINQLKEYEMLQFDSSNDYPLKKAENIALEFYGK